MFEVGVAAVPGLESLPQGDEQLAQGRMGLHEEDPVQVLLGAGYVVVLIPEEALGVAHSMRIGGVGGQGHQGQGQPKRCGPA